MVPFPRCHGPYRVPSPEAPQPSPSQFAKAVLLLLMKIFTSTQRLLQLQSTSQPWVGQGAGEGCGEVLKKARLTL